ncbi:hypothetical protein C922_04534 [Plasmodium inui San Antonio 1]|uniref:Uncharacterized protein n=1 Tax=Plasmodium inui San Antonio 1 TaxID=1237626 RepID=W7A149_9APIC|nr:hypothetical protein C922_04534 [Plasmodium inui San Antonio 1]EUD65023.1 hypothetical protein C922_04534 [Plasmodium inui San Antonio 1]
MSDARLPNDLRNGEHSRICGKSQMDLIVRKEIGKWVLLHRFIHKHDGLAGKKTLVREKMAKQHEPPSEHPIGQSADEATEQPDDQSDDPPTDQLVDKPTGQPADQPTGHRNVFNLFYHPTGTRLMRRGYWQVVAPEETSPPSAFTYTPVDQKTSCTGPSDVSVEECSSKVTENDAIQKFPSQNNLSEQPKFKEDSKESLFDSPADTKKVKKKVTKKNGISKDATKAIISRCINIKSYIDQHKMSFQNMLINLFNEYTFLKRYMSSNYNTYHKLKFFLSCNHYVKKLHDVLSIFADVVEESDEYLMIELYKKIKLNMRLLYYVGRVLSNYFTCIAYKRMAYVIMICLSRVHTIFKCMLVSEPFKSDVLELLKMIECILESGNPRVVHDKRKKYVDDVFDLALSNLRSGRGKIQKLQKIDLNGVSNEIQNRESYLESESLTLSNGFSSDVANTTQVNERHDQCIFSAKANYDSKDSDDEEHFECSPRFRNDEEIRLFNENIKRKFFNDLFDYYKIIKLEHLDEVCNCRQSAYTCEVRYLGRRSGRRRLATGRD